MTKYVAFLRGITPSNPNMSNERLRGVCESLGLRAVETVISSGNVLFGTERGDLPNLESELEAAWPERLGFNSVTIIRSQYDLTRLVEQTPFGDLEHSRQTYLLVTFFQKPYRFDPTFPHRPEDRDYSIIGGTGRELFSVTDTTSATSPDVMTWMDRTFGKRVSSRTWLTVTKILKRMM